MRVLRICTNSYQPSIKLKVENYWKSYHMMKTMLVSIIPSSCIETIMRKLSVKFMFNWVNQINTMIYMKNEGSGQ